MVSGVGTSGVGDVDPFHRHGPPPWDGGEGWGPYVEAMRRVQDLVGSTNPPAETMALAMAQLESLADLLEPWRCTEAEMIAGRRHDLPGRGNPFLPPFVVDEQDADSVRGRVTFTDHHLGGNAAAHGGALSLMFDEVMGWLANSSGRPIARTAYLHIDYRSITPLGTAVTFEARIEREEGRKCFARATLDDGARRLADVECLFVTLLPGQR